MRLVLALVLLALPLAAEDPAAETLASRFPAGATAYLEVRGLAGRIDALWDSELGRAVREHEKTRAFLASDEGKKLVFGHALLQGAVGMDARGVLRAVASREVGIAVYGKPERFVAMARVDPLKAPVLLRGAELAMQRARTEIVPADAAGPAVWAFGPMFVMLEGDLLVVSPQRESVAAVRARAAEGIDGHAFYKEARAQIDRDALAFVVADLAPFRQQLAAQSGKPKDLGQAMFLGAFAHYVPEAKWGALALDLAGEGDTWALEARGVIPAPATPSPEVAAAYAGDLRPLPFALPANTIGVVRMHRDLASVWSNRDELIAERGIPGLVEFETNFGNLTGGMSWAEEFLPRLGDEMILIGVRKEFVDGEAAPAVRYPQGALVFPLKEAGDLPLRLQVAFQTTIGILNAQAAQQKMQPFMLGSKEYKGVLIQTARYLPPMGGVQAEPLPARYNVEPSLAIVNNHLVLASGPEILQGLIDGRDGATAPPAGVNAGLWLEPAELRAILLDNRQALIAQRMLEEGEDHAAAAANVDLALELARYLRGVSFTVEESRASLGLKARVALGPVKE